MYASGSATGGWKIASAGTDLSKLDISGSGMKADGINQASALSHGAKMITDITKIQANTALIGAGISAVKSVGNKAVESFSD